MLRVLWVLTVRVLMVPAALVLMVPAACSDLRVKEGIYATVDEAKAAGAIQAGWVPAGLPASAADVREGHLPDGRHWGVFTFAPGDADGVRALVGPEMTNGPLLCEPPGRLEWWPRILYGEIDLNTVRSTGFRVYHEPGGPRTFAVNWGQGRAYYWRG